MARARVLQVNHEWGRHARQTDLREKTPHQPIIAIDYARQPDVASRKTGLGSRFLHDSNPRQERWHAKDNSNLERGAGRTAPRRL